MLLKDKVTLILWRRWWLPLTDASSRDALLLPYANV
jgi:hypothetical protein